MSIKRNVKAMTGSAAVLWLLAGLVADPAAKAFGPIGSSELDQRMCEFSLQLQNSVQTRKEYLAQVVEATGEGESSVEAMYGNVKKASYSGSDQSEDTLDLWGLGGNKSAQRQPGLDQMSLNCLGCHDGSVASAIHTDLRNDPFAKGSRVDSFGSDHPMGMDYGRYASARDDYNQVLPGSNKMIFVNGRVGCLTCHNPLNMERGHLVMSDRNSALCLTCHRK